MTWSVHKLTAALAVAFALAVPVTAEAFSGRKGTRVNPVDSIVFEVMARTAGSAPTYWCGAGDYASVVLRADWGARIYVARGRGPSDTTGRKTAVQFTLDPYAANVEPIYPAFFMNQFRVGDSMTVSQAVSHCLRFPYRF